MRAPLPHDEADRLRALERYQVLDTPNEAAFDRITALAARLFEVPMALVSLVDAERQWWKSCVGLEGTGTERDVAFCAHAILSSDPLIVEDAALDARFADNRLVTGAPHLRFYAGAPLTSSDGLRLGTLCILHSQPRRLTALEVATLVDLSRIVVDELELRLSNATLLATRQRLAESEERLAERVGVLEVILESAGEGIVVLDEHGSFAVYNPAARRIIPEAPRVGETSASPRAYTLHWPASGEPCDTKDLPLSRALRGESSDNLELLVRSAGRLDRLIRVTGRPLRDAQGRGRGGIITFNDITALRAAEDELARRAVTDPLTGLPNRRALDERLALLVAEGGRGRKFALVLGDVDHFKRVNDTFGHATGDEVLVHVARQLQQHVRRTDFVARFGGEEFCVLFTDVDEPLAVRLADQLRTVIAEGQCSVPVTISLGVCANRPHELTQPSALLQAADSALYAAKNQGRNRVQACPLATPEANPGLSAIGARAPAQG